LCEGEVRAALTVLYKMISDGQGKRNPCRRGRRVAMFQIHMESCKFSPTIVELKLEIKRKQR
jgi:hypothetical protein